MKAHLVLYIEIDEPTAWHWFDTARNVINLLEKANIDVIHAETIDQEKDIGGVS